jgi:hypothetical protein
MPDNVELLLEFGAVLLTVVLDDQVDSFLLNNSLIREENLSSDSPYIKGFETLFRNTVQKKV